MTALLIDADIIVYRFAAEGEVSVESAEAPGTWMVSANAETSIANADAYIASLVNRFKPTEHVLCATDTHNFRRDVDASYKSQRSSQRPPILLQYMKDWVRAKPITKVKAGLEADDVMGIMSTNPYNFPGLKKIIVSIDKDMEQIPGWLFNPRKDDAPREITKVQGDRMFYSQVLTGDSTDGYPGLRGCGPKTAAKLLEGLTDEADLWAATVAAFKARGLAPEYAVTQARLARILRYEDYDFATNKPKLWSPPDAPVQEPT